MQHAQTHEVDRVRAHTAPQINYRLDRELEERIRYYSTLDHAAITRRITELDHEWDIERVLETNASALAFTGIAMGILTRKKAWFMLPGVVLPFLFQHAIQGWCPPVPVLRRLGVRTRREIDQEKYALKVLRGDLDPVQSTTEPLERALAAMNAVKA